MKWWIRAGVLLFGIIMGLYRMPVFKVSSGDKSSSSVRYVALGDSIAYGYGLSDREKDSYVGQVGKYLEQKYDYVFEENFGTNGLRSEQLLDILTNPKNEQYNKYRATLKNADIVTLSIGSNDLLHLVRLDFNLQDYIQKGDRMFREACDDFAVNFPKIIRIIHSMAPRAKIYVNNVYNPCDGVAGFESVYRLAERYIDLLNESFRNNSGFILVDIKDRFDKVDESLLNMTISGREIDPHPNKKGHREIGSMVIQAIKGETENAD